MKVLTKILYKPYLLLFLGLALWLYYFAKDHPIGAVLTAIFSCIIYTLFMLFAFSFLKNSLLKLQIYVKVFNNVPNKVLSGYLFIFVFFAPLPVIAIAIISKLFIHPKEHDQTYTDDYGNQVTSIRSLTPTVLLRRKESKDEYIAITKLSKKPKKITYE
jgi:hypothetical protein